LFGNFAVKRKDRFSINAGPVFFIEELFLETHGTKK
jgi:hypothetical protein